MPLSIISILDIIPTNVWTPIKKLVTKNGFILTDLPFTITTKYTAALVIILMSLSVGNELFRNIELDCSATGIVQSKQDAFDGIITYEELNDFCWNHGTFLVARALEPHMRSKVTYPGVSAYDKAQDELITQTYYKYLWIVYAILAAITVFPHCLWKTIALAKMEPLIHIEHTSEYSEEQQRLKLFVATVGINNNFATSYVLCKVLTTLSPVCQWMFLTLFIGKNFKMYGFNVLTHLLSNKNNWPNPMDKVFPKMAKCEWSRYGHSGDIELKSAQCHMPINDISQWIFFMYWFWLFVLLCLNTVSLMFLCVHLLKCVRTYRYIKFVAVLCQEDVENVRTVNLGGRNLRYRKDEVIAINIAFSDWLVMFFLQKNLSDVKFAEFIHDLVEDNRVIQVKAPVYAFSTFN